jgi:hypothetical protein
LVKRGGHRYGLKTHEGRVTLVGVEGFRYDYDVEVAIIGDLYPVVGLRSVTVTARDGDLVTTGAVRDELARVRFEAVRVTSMFVDDDGIAQGDTQPTIADVQSALRWRKNGPTPPDHAELRRVAAAVMAAEAAGTPRFRAVAQALGLSYPEHKSLTAKRIRQARARGLLPPASAGSPPGRRRGMGDRRATS